jgi:hypothetical protein
MSRFSRIRRRPDHWPSPHARARTRAAERLAGPLGLAEANWLAEHLEGCRDCTAIVAAYERDQVELRGLRERRPEPPRDLWARTAAGIEHAAGAGDAGRSSGRRRYPLGALSGIAVVVVVIGLSVVSGGLLRTTTVEPNGEVAPSATAAAQTAGASIEPAPGPSSFTVGAGTVQWVGRSADGSLAFNTAPIRKVCPFDRASECATLNEATGQILALVANPKSIISSPNHGQAIVVSDDGTGNQRVILLALPTPEPTETPMPSPTGSAAPSATSAPTERTSPPPSPKPSEPPASPTPTEPPATSSPPPDGPIPTLTPEPTLATDLAIASDVTVVGESAAFSADGDWFAFSARPSGPSAGPDVYVWRVGDDTARALTSGGETSFASWDDGMIIASRPGEPLADGTFRPVTVRIDPVNGEEVEAGDLWRPIVDPTGSFAVGWDGTVTTSSDPRVIGPADGQLELRPWSAEAGSVSADAPLATVSDGPIRTYDIRWDETGSWFAVWIADPVGTEIGRLSLYRVDPETGELSQPDGAPADVQSLAGFSIGQGRLAWATPPGQDGDGSRVQVVAWAPEGVGTVETDPGEGLIVIR